MGRKSPTEAPSPHRDLEERETGEILQRINEEDRTVPLAIHERIPVIHSFIDALVDKMQNGGRLFYIGAGTSGRLGILDAAECPPTYGVPYGLVNALIAGGDGAIRKAVEFAEDDPEQGWKDLQEYEVGQDDVVTGIAASGTTPYVVGALEKCREHGMITGAITSNPESPVARAATYPIEVDTGPEFVTGSTRMKAGTAQKLVLNMISTTAMIRLGRVKDNRMVDMQLSNTKLVDRGTKMVMEALELPYEAANKLLKEHGSVRKAIAKGRSTG